MPDYILPAQLAGLRMASPSDQAVEGRLRPEFLLTTQDLAQFLLSLKTIGIKLLPWRCCCVKLREASRHLSGICYVTGPVTGAFPDLSSVSQS